ncbi:MAG: hypothetical protein QNJ44_11230 [Rhodobacter sp.]|nr:hypothetical protein [Rhodobacter sp.]
MGILVNALLLIYLAIPGSVGNSFLLESQINVRLITFLVISVIVNEIFTVTLTKYFSWLSVRHSSFYPIVIDILFLIGCIYVLPVIYFLGVSEKFLSIDLGYVREGFETTELNDILIVLQIMWSDFAQLLYVFTPVIN